MNKSVSSYFTGFKILSFSAAATLFLSSQSSFAKLKPEVVYGIENAKIIIKTGGPLAAVQPIASLSFDYTSCSARQFSVRVSKLKSGVTNLTVLQGPNQKECKGPAIKRNYNLVVSTDAKVGTRYVLTNPLSVEVTQMGQKPIAPTPEPIAQEPNPISEPLKACMNELTAAILKSYGAGGFEGLSLITKDEARDMLENAPWDEINENEHANAKKMLSENMSLAFAIQWTAPGNSGTSVVIVPNRDNCKVFSDYVTWSEE